MLVRLPWWHSISVALMGKNGRVKRWVFTPSHPCDALQAYVTNNALPVKKKNDRSKQLHMQCIQHTIIWMGAPTSTHNSSNLCFITLRLPFPICWDCTMTHMETPQYEKLDCAKIKGKHGGAMNGVKRNEWEKIQTEEKRGNLEILPSILTSCHDH